MNIEKIRSQFLEKVNQIKNAQEFEELRVKLEKPALKPSPPYFLPKALRRRQNKNAHAPERYEQAFEPVLEVMSCAPTFQRVPGTGPRQKEEHGHKPEVQEPHEHKQRNGTFRIGDVPVRKSEKPGAME